MKIKQIKIDFNVTPEIKRYVYVYLISTDKGCILIDSGVYNSESVIEKAILESGHKVNDLKAIFLTHAHPDHIGTANYFREKYGTMIYASEGEKAWIEDIDLQFKERPIPNFYNIAGKSTPVDKIVKEGDVIELFDNISVCVISTPGHSTDEVSYRIGKSMFIGDSVLVGGDIPIFVNINDTKASLDKLNRYDDVEIFYPAWDREYLRDEMKEKLKDARKIVDEIEACVHEADHKEELPILVRNVCEMMNTPMFKSNPLFARTVECCRRGK